MLAREDGKNPRKEIEKMKTLITITGTLLLAATAALAGPPIICQRVEIGNARSLPWREVKGWDGADRQYDVTRLSADTLAALSADPALNVHMETLRRAAVYAVKKEGLADQLAARLLARAANSEAAGKPDAMAWFDAGYFAEAMRQMAFVQRYMKPAGQAQWAWNGESWTLDGKPWIDHARSLGAKGLEVPLAKVEELRLADLKRAQAGS